MNKIMAIGRLGQDVEYNAEKQYARVSLAVDRKLTKEQKDRGLQSVDWFPLVLFGKMAETAAKYLKKGSKIAIDGRLSESKWEKDGKKFSRLDVVVERFDFLDAKPATGAAPTTAPAAPSAAAFGTSVADEEIPF